MKLPDWNLSAMGADAAASGVNTALQQFLARTNLPEAPLELQEACTRLLGWIQEHPDRAQRCFPAFCSEEAQMKLLTPKAAVSLRRKAERFNELLALAGTEDPETLIRLVQKRAENVPPPELFEYYDPESGLLMDEDWTGLGSEAKSDRLRRIGEAGERCAFQAVVDYFVRQGFTAERDDGSIAELESGDGKPRVTDCRPDTEDFKQPGWDISVQIRDGRGDLLTITDYFLEVKTHTARSCVRSHLPLSDAQMRMAVSVGNAYILLLVLYDEERDQAVELRPFRDIPEQIAAGVLRSASGRYELEVLQQGIPETEKLIPA